MVNQILISSKTLIPFIRFSNYAFHREDISFSKLVLSDTCHGKVVQYSERIVVRRFAHNTHTIVTETCCTYIDNIIYILCTYNNIMYITNMHSTL